MYGIFLASTYVPGAVELPAALSSEVVETLKALEPSRPLNDRRAIRVSGHAQKPAASYRVGREIQAPVCVGRRHWALRPRPHTFRHEKGPHLQSSAREMFVPQTEPPPSHGWRRNSAAPWPEPQRRSRREHKRRQIRIGALSSLSWFEFTEYGLGEQGKRSVAEHSGSTIAACGGAENRNLTTINTDDTDLERSWQENNPVKISVIREISGMGLTAVKASVSRRHFPARMRCIYTRATWLPQHGKHQLRANPT